MSTKQTIVIVLIALILSACSGSAGVPVMDGPSSDAVRLDMITPGTEYTVLMDLPDNWALIEYFSENFNTTCTGFIRVQR